MKGFIVFALVLITFGKWPFVLNIPIVLMLSVIVLFLRYVNKRLSLIFTIVFVILLAVFVASFHISLYQNKINTALTIDKNSQVLAKVVSLFTGVSEQSRILVKVMAINGQKLQTSKAFNAQLYWHKRQPIKQGQLWQITGRFREPYGRVNEAGFDAEVYYLSRHIHAKGSIISAKLINNELSLRQRFFDWLYPKIQHFSYARFLVALSFGERELLKRDDWQNLKNTGLAHLLAISGLHIGLAYLFAFYLVNSAKTLLFRHSQQLYLPFILGLAFAFLYAWLAGFSLPTQRAVFALAIFTLIRVSGYSISAFGLLLLVLCSLLFFVPFAVFSTSFWLSFSAIVVLILFFTVFNVKPPNTQPTFEKLILYIKQLFLVQCFLIVGMIPVMAQSFNGMSISGILFNLFAVPWVSIIVVPLILLAIIFSFFEIFIFWSIANASLAPLIKILPYADDHWLSLEGVPFFWLCLIPVFMLGLYYRLWRLPVFFTSFCLVLLCWQDKKNATTDWQLDILDVGHGLAVLLSKNGKALLYDTGQAWSKGSIAESVIEPVIKKRGLELTDIVLSHSDKDHAGGIDWLKAQYPQAKVRAVQPKKGYLPCIAGERWQWQGLFFDVLLPKKAVDKPKNAHSCVIRVFDSQHAVLLTGDLLKQQEQLLLEDKPAILSTVLIVPHHGSKSSSSIAFLQAVAPKAAIVSRGRYTPWDLPNKEVVVRYQKLGIDWHDTAIEGQVRVLFSRFGYQIKTLRFDISPFWYRKNLGRAARIRVE